MGYSKGMNPDTGRMVLCCDICGKIKVSVFHRPTADVKVQLGILPKKVASGGGKCMIGRLIEEKRH